MQVNARVSILSTLDNRDGAQPASDCLSRLIGIIRAAAEACIGGWLRSPGLVSRRIFRVPASRHVSEGRGGFPGFPGFDIAQPVRSKGRA